MLEKVHILQRILLTNMIPTSGSWAQDTVWADCRKKIEITAEEVMRYDIVLSQNGIKWAEFIDDEKDEDGNHIEGTGTPCNLIEQTDKPIKWPLTEKEEKICKFKSFLKKLERSDDGLPSTHVDLYEIFVGAAPVDLDVLAKLADEAEAAEDAKYEAKQDKKDEAEE